MQYIDFLYSYAYQLASRSDFAEELVEATYSSVLEAEAPNTAGIKCWLLRMLRNKWQERTRVQCFQSAVEELQVNTADSRSQTATLSQALLTLPSGLNEILFLRESARLSYQDIAIVLNCSVTRVVFCLGNARRQLKMLLAKDFDRAR
ncbi:RNA polymerase sigma factor [Silvibacterium acidisoli]|uniref:RNA polymerase sigma factor n=1 Tax=Acidobacteriaceae bacterium ZG23-2 TaxID=2883246 RepID=UPI00406C6F41